MLSKIETGNTNRSERTGQEGRNRKERIDGKGEVQLRRTLVETHVQEFLNRYRNTNRMTKSEKFRREQKGM